MSQTRVLAMEAQDVWQLVFSIQWQLWECLLMDMGSDMTMEYSHKRYQISNRYHIIKVEPFNCDMISKILSYDVYCFKLGLQQPLDNGMHGIIQTTFKWIVQGLLGLAYMPTKENSCNGLILPQKDLGHFSMKIQKTFEFIMG